MKEVLIKCLVVMIVSLLVAIFFWIKSFVIYKRDHTQKVKSIIYKGIALILLIVGLCAFTFAAYKKLQTERKVQEFTNDIMDDYREKNDQLDLGLYKCPKCGHPAMAGRSHSCDA